VKKLDAWDRPVGDRREKALQAKCLLPRFADDTLVTNGQIHLARSIQMHAKEKPTDLRPRQHLVEPALHRPVAAAFVRPARDVFVNQKTRHLIIRNRVSWMDRTLQ
jgi:hypothetical protein